MAAQPGDAQITGSNRGSVRGFLHGREHGLAVEEAGTILHTTTAENRRGVTHTTSQLREK